MTDLFGDAPRAPARPVRRSKATAPICKPAPNYAEPMPVHAGEDRARSYACPCGARDEVQRPAPDALDCYSCGGLETMRAYAPRYSPPVGAGRQLTAHEREGMTLDS